MSHFKYVLPTVCLLSVFAFVACKIEPQTAREIFYDPGLNTKLPPQIDSLANPKPSQSQINHMNQKDPKGRVRVAVIDNGVDYTHPNLYQQIHFTRNKQGQIVGAGFDMLGNDFWAHPNLINPTLYAFVATEIKDNRLSGVQGDPLKWILDTQDKFYTALRARIQNDPAVRDTLAGKKWESATLSVFMASTFLKDFAEREKDPEDNFQYFLKQGAIISEKDQKNPALMKKWGPFDIESALNKPWIFIGANGTPSNFVYRTEGMNLLVGHIQAVYTQLNAQEKIEQRAKNYAQYKSAMEQENVDVFKSYMDAADAWETLYFKYANKNELSSLIQELCTLFPKSVTARLSNPDLKSQQRWEIVKLELDRQKMVLTNYMRSKLPLFHADSQKFAAESIRDGARIFALIEDTFKTQPWAANYLNCQGGEKSLLIKDAGLLAYNEKKYHPLLNIESHSETHGTHVAGIIARQSKKIDIVPVRVATASTMQVPSTGALLRKQFNEGFGMWISSDEYKVMEAINTAMKVKLGKTMTHQELYEGMMSYTDTTFNDNYLDFLFFDQIAKAIKYVGANQVKVANMSLGTSFEKDVFDPSQGGKESALQNFMQYLTYEYFKFVLGQTIQTYAKNTLFVIASGNDGKWIDGKSRSALPCDISSAMLAAVGSVATAKAPNNQVNNVLCVGSIDYNGELSSYSNIPFTNVPFIFSYGESVLSTIKTSDCEGVEKDVAHTFGNPPDAFLINFTNVGEESANKNDKERLCTSLGLIESLTGDIIQDRFKSRKCHRALLTYDMLSAKKAAVTARCLKQKGKFARLSGTSMATPAVAGYIARQLVPVANKMNLTAEQLYNHPDYTPAKIIEMIKTKSSVFGGPSVLKDVSVVKDIKKLNPNIKPIGVVKIETLMDGPVQ